MERYRLWLDSMINHSERIRQMNMMYPEISSLHVRGKYLQMSSGIQVLAAAVGKDLEVSTDDDRSVRYRFPYRGYTIFQIVSTDV